MLANIINICFDVIYIKFFALGIGGAALASSTGFLMGSIFISYYFFKSERTLQFIKLKAGKFFNYLKEIVTSGFSNIYPKQNVYDEQLQCQVQLC